MCASVGIMSVIVVVEMLVSLQLLPRKHENRCVRSTLEALSVPSATC